MTTRSAEDNRTAALQVSYELVSMVEMALLLRDGTTNGAVQNALLEGALLHCRNLIDFLGPWPHQGDDIKPSDFVAGWDPSLLKVSTSARRAIHKHLAHLTWTRVDEGKVAWEFPGIFADTFETMGKFVEHCETKQAPTAPIFRINYELALAALKAKSPADNSDDDLDFITASDSPLFLDDFREPSPPDEDADG